MNSFYRAVKLVVLVWVAAMASQVVVLLLGYKPSMESMHFAVILTLFVCVIERQMRNEDE